MVTKQRSNSKSGFRGVGWNGHSWRAKIKIWGKTISLGTFTNIEKALEEYDKAREEIRSFGKQKFLDNSNLK